MNDFEDDWDVDQVIAGLGDGERQATQNLRDAHVAAVEATTEAETTQMSAPPGTRKAKEAAALVAAAVLHRERLGEVIKQREKRNPTGGIQGINKLDLAKMYLGKAVECPICFLCVLSQAPLTSCGATGENGSFADSVGPPPLHRR